MIDEPEKLLPQFYGVSSSVESSDFLRRWCLLIAHNCAVMSQHCCVDCDDALVSVMEGRKVDRLADAEDG